MDQLNSEKGRRAQEEIAQFAALFPQVKGEEVPREVWQAVKEGQPLALAYSLWRIRVLEEERARRERGERLSPGSVSSAGSGGNAGTLAAYWDAYQM